MHALPCKVNQPSQVWRFNGTNDTLQATSQAPIAGGGGGADGSPPCLRVISTWLWATPIVTTESWSAGCDASKPGHNEQWTLHNNGTLSNGQFGCIEVSRDTGPPTTIWAKPLERGRFALLAINGADMLQTISLDFSELLLEGGMLSLDANASVAAASDVTASAAASNEWEVRDVWSAVDLGKRTGLSRDVPPHDCILLVLSPA